MECSVTFWLIVQSETSSNLITRRAEFHGLCPWVNVEFLNAGNMGIQMNLPKKLIMAGTPAFRSSFA
jgi:hypothetical protein